MRKSSGFTLLELLVAITILTIILGITYAAISEGLRVQSSQEAATSSQAKLRRITEVFTQELRSAVLGAIADAPYASATSSVSFTLLDGGAGYQVLPHDSGNNNSFKNAANVRLIAPELDLATGDQALMVNASGQAILFDVGTVTRVGGSGSVEWNVVHPGCANTIDYTPNTLLFKVRSVGLSYDPTTKTLYQREGSGAAVPLAFDLSSFRIDYVYQDSDGTPYAFGEPRKVGGKPVRNDSYGGKTVQLARLQLSVGSEAKALTGTVKRSYLSQIELSSNPSFQIQAVTTCK